MSEMYRRPFHRQATSLFVGASILALGVYGAWSGLKAVLGENAPFIGVVEEKVISTTRAWTPERCAAHPVSCLRDQLAYYERVYAEAQPAIARLREQRRGLEGRTRESIERAAQLGSLRQTINSAIDSTPDKVVEVSLLGKRIPLEQARERLDLVGQELTVAESRRDEMRKVIKLIDDRLRQVYGDMHAIRNEIDLGEARVVLVEVEMMIANARDQQAMLKPVIDKLFATGEAVERVESWTSAADDLEGMLRVHATLGEQEGL